MKIKIVAVGKMSEPYIRLEKEFIKRFRSSTLSLDIHEVKEVKEKNIALKKKKEAQNIEKTFAPGDSIILMEKKGRLFSSSEDFAALLRTIPQPALVIGSDAGLDASLKTKEYDSFSFSRLTFPHQLFRIMLYEQLYRIQCIWTNHPYHK